MAQVGCAGLLVEDIFCGPLKALPPEGALHLLDDMPVRAGGCAANVAIDLAKQGISVDVAGCVGRDSAAELLLSTFTARHIGSSAVVRVEGGSTSKTVILLVEGQDRRYFHVAGANRAFALEHLSRDWAAGLNVFYLGGLFALPGLDVGALGEFLRFCRAARVMTVADVVCPQQLQGLGELGNILQHIDVFVPNEDEARAFTGVTDCFDQLRAFQKAGANTVIITRGSEGSVAAKGEKTWSCGSYQMNAVDPSGSGDAFASGIIRGLLMGWEMPQMLRYASALGASATRAAGTTDAVFTAAEAESFIAQHPLRVTQSPMSPQAISI
jgi:sugar/nucleoside kinase (ribokinase family)